MDPRILEILSKNVASSAQAAPNKEAPSQETSATGAPTQADETGDLGALPPQLKALIMSYVDEKTRNKTLRVPHHLLLDPMRHDCLLELALALHAVFDYSYAPMCYLNHRFVDSLEFPEKLNFLTAADLEALDKVGYVVKDGFLKDVELINAVREEARGMKENGILQLAGMNQGREQWRDKTVRGDLHAWVNDIQQIATERPNLVTLLKRMDGIRHELNAACPKFDSPRCQTQVACYPGEGARYVRHLDAFIGGSNRRVTVLYYMNADWKKEDGGCLRVFLPREVAQAANLPQLATADPSDDEISIDIEPLCDRVLIFQSRTVEHEVLPAHKERFSITTWFY